MDNKFRDLPFLSKNNAVSNVSALDQRQHYENFNGICRKRKSLFATPPHAAQKESM